MMGFNDGKPMLSGIKIVDLTSVVFGPYATQILAELGAEVIKVESPPIGDSFRWAGRAATTPGMAPGFLAINARKKSVTLDLKQAEDLAAMKSLLAEADVFIHNVRAKGITRLGLDYESVKAVNAGIIYAHCVGFGQSGPYADLQAYDDVIQAATGTATLLSRVDGNPRARYLPSLIADKVAGLHAAYAVLAAIVHKLRTGEGQRIEIPMFESFARFMLVEHLAGLTFAPPNGPACYFRQIDPDRQPFPTADGFISIVIYNDDSWFRVFDLLGAPELLKEDRFATRKLRSTNLALLYQHVARLTLAFDTADLVARCQQADIPAQAVRDIGDILQDEHLQATGFFERREHPTEGPYFAMASPVTFGVDARAPSGDAPLLGQHNDIARAAVPKPGCRVKVGRFMFYRHASLNEWLRAHEVGFAATGCTQ